jgi:dipeptidyl aminopeptidase/acylaminoacyl peptidase
MKYVLVLRSFLLLAIPSVLGFAAFGQGSPKVLILSGERLSVDGRPGFIFMPPEEKRSKPQPWVMYAPTLAGYPDGHEKWMHQQFLDAGIAIAGIDVGEAYGSPKGREGLTALYAELTRKRGFASRPVLLGRSRGGLWVTSWALENPDKVAGIAGIYPVLDLRTYPSRAKAAAAFELSEAELKAKLGDLNPINHVDVLARHKVPMFIIHGDDDKVVPLKQNAAELVARYKAAGQGNAVTLIVAKGQGHNYWEGFFHCQPLVNFVIARAKAK